ncbi:unnamed protein product, partial [Mesorhabditis belari]|uniref:Uncharacterized protein n=1 Tax=Mesorhabditis belari TaxID=2138241 RepID=A0AAF3E8V8_9BILA
MDVATERVGRPHPRPTQAYYIPPRRQQCGLPSTVISNDKKEDTGPRERCTINPRAEGLRDKNEKGKRNEYKHDPQVQRSPNSPKSPDAKVTVQATKQTVAKPMRKTSPKTESSQKLLENEVLSPSQKNEKSNGGNLNLNTPIVTLNLNKQVKTTINQREQKKASCRSQAVPRARSPVYNQDAPILLKSEKKDLCICDRPPTHLYCKRCSYECKGRILRVCSVHPTRLALMDLRECPNSLCHSIQLAEMDDITKQPKDSTKCDSSNETHLI